MSLKKHGLRALGLSILASLGLMAFMAAGAQAAEFLVETASGVFKEFKQILTASEPIDGALEENGTLLIDGLGIEITCTGVNVANGLALEGGVVHGTLLYTGCTVLSSAAGLAELAACTVQDEKDATVGKIATEDILGLAITHNSELYYLIEAPSGLFTSIEVLGATCAAKGLYKVTGTTVIKVTEGHALNLLIKPALASLFQPTDELKFGNRTALLLGSAANVKLAAGGSFPDKNWGVKK